MKSKDEKQSAMDLIILSVLEPVVTSAIMDSIPVEERVQTSRYGVAMTPMPKGFFWDGFDALREAGLIGGWKYYPIGTALDDEVGTVVLSLSEKTDNERGRKECAKAMSETAAHFVNMVAEFALDDRVSKMVMEYDFDDPQKMEEVVREMCKDDSFSSPEIYQRAKDEVLYARKIVRWLRTTGMYKFMTTRENLKKYEGFFEEERG